MSSPIKEELHELFHWFQGVDGCLDKYKKLNNIEGDNRNEEVVQKIRLTLENIELSLDKIGLSLGIELSKWKAMTHDERLLTIYKQLPDDEKDDFKQAAPHLFTNKMAPYPENNDMAKQYEKLLNFGKNIDKTMNDKLIGIMREYDEKNLVVDATTEQARLDKMISTIGFLLNIENWEGKTYDDKYKILSDKLIGHLENLIARNKEARNKEKDSIGTTEFKSSSGGRNKSKKPKRRNSRSKRRNSRSKRRKTVSKRRR
jgi:cell fate (sporulation/competence/biofilm development) regulator YlbF (YheA/YmcA/DUF963 family)